MVTADASPSAARVLAHMLEHAGLTVVGTAADGPAAVEAVRRLQPDVLTLSVELPQLDGLAVLDEVMTHCPTPTVFVTSLGRARMDRTLTALERGAVDFVLKCAPGQQRRPPAEIARELAAKVRMAAGVKVIRRIAVPPRRTTACKQPREPSSSNVVGGLRRDATHVVVLGASTGGPPALRAFLSELPRDFAAAVLVVQHIPAPFTVALAEWLNRTIGPCVRIAEQGDRLRPATVFLAPGDKHLTIRADGRLELDDGPPQHGYRPAVDRLLVSAAEVFGSRACGVILSGMGGDGAAGLLAVRRGGGWTGAQQEDGCAIFGMPKRAVELGAAQWVADPAALALRVAEFVHAHARSLET